MKKRKQIAAAAAILVFCVCIARIIYVNASSERPSRFVYEKGEACTYQDMTYRISDCSIYEQEEDVQRYISDFSDQGKQLYETRYVVIGMEVTYVGTEQQKKFSKSGMHVQANAWTNGIEAYEFTDQDSILLPNQTKKVYMCVRVVHSKWTVTEHFWTHLEDRPYEVVLSTYPDIIIMKAN